MPRHRVGQWYQNIIINYRYVAGFNSQLRSWTSFPNEIPKRKVYYYK